MVPGALTMGMLAFWPAWMNYANRFRKALVPKTASPATTLAYPLADYRL